MTNEEIIAGIKKLIAQLDQPQEIEWKGGYPIKNDYGTVSEVLAAKGCQPNSYDFFQAGWHLDTTTPSTLRWIPHLGESRPSNISYEYVIVRTRNGNNILGIANSFTWNREDTTIVSYAIILNPVPQWLSADAERKEGK